MVINVIDYRQEQLPYFLSTIKKQCPEQELLSSNNSEAYNLDKTPNRGTVLKNSQKVNHRKICRQQD
jgi:hypothetical protein